VRSNKTMSFVFILEVLIVLTYFAMAVISGLVPWGFI
jgi:hypothetical protein